MVVVLNATTRDVALVLPGREGAVYTVVLDTSVSDGAADPAPRPAGSPLPVAAGAVVVATAPLAR